MLGVDFSCGDRTGNQLFVGVKFVETQFVETQFVDVKEAQPGVSALILV